MNSHNSEGVDRRTLLKGAVGAGTMAAVWVAPRVETLGFLPAAAATPCIILSPEADDKNSQLGQNDCPIPNKPCCNQSFGNAGGTPDTFTFTNPAPNCSEIVVRTITLDCDPGNGGENPDAGQFAMVISSHTGAGCGTCTVFESVLLESSQREVILARNNGVVACMEGGIDGSFTCQEIVDAGSDARLAVRIRCVTGNPGCVDT